MVAMGKRLMASTGSIINLFKRPYMHILKLFRMAQIAKKKKKKKFYLQNNHMSLTQLCSGSSRKVQLWGKRIFQRTEEPSFLHLSSWLKYILTSISGRALSALNSVMVFPLPGGPHNTIGLCSASHVYSRASCRTVSRVGTTTSGEATLCVSTSICGTLDAHGTHSPVMETWTGAGGNECMKNLF